MLNVMNQVAAADIEHEKNGDPPPQHFASWPAYWQHHFATLHYTPPKHEKANDPMRNVGSENLAFVKQRRAELGLPPFDRPASLRAKKKDQQCRPFFLFTVR